MSGFEAGMKVRCQVSSTCQEEYQVREREITAGPCILEVSIHWRVGVGLLKTHKVVDGEHAIKRTRELYDLGTEERLDSSAVLGCGD